MLVSALKLLAQFVFVQTMMLLFISPFYLIYRRQRDRSDGKRISHSQHLENFFLSKHANYLVFFWAFGEALIWFVIPEFLLLLVLFMRIRRKRELLKYDVAGTIAGTFIAFFWGASNHIIASLPYIQPKMVEQTLSWYQQEGVWGLIHQPFSGVPYKVFTLTADRFGFFFPYFLVVAVLVRMSRYFITYCLLTLIYPGLHPFVKRNYVRLVLVATFVFSLLLVRVVHTFGPQYVVK